MCGVGDYPSELRLCPLFLVGTCQVVDTEYYPGVVVLHSFGCNLIWLVGS